jgi:hypothetical protein
MIISENIPSTSRGRLVLGAFAFQASACISPQAVPDRAPALAISGAAHIGTSDAYMTDTQAKRNPQIINVPRRSLRKRSTITCGD